MVTPGGLVGSSEGAYGRVPRGGGGVQVQGVFLRKAGFSVSVHYHLQQSKTRTKDIKHKKKTHLIHVIEMCYTRALDIKNTLNTLDSCIILVPVIPSNTIIHYYCMGNYLRYPKTE